MILNDLSGKGLCSSLCQIAFHQHTDTCCERFSLDSRENEKRKRVILEIKHSLYGMPTR